MVSRMYPPTELRLSLDRFVALKHAAIEEFHGKYPTASRRLGFDPLSS